MIDEFQLLSFLLMVEYKIILKFFQYVNGTHRNCKDKKIF